MTSNPLDPARPVQQPDPQRADGSKPAAAADAAKSEAQHVTQVASGAASQVSDTAKQQARQVNSDIREQARQLADETRTQLSEQAGAQRDRAVDGLRLLGDELREMSDKEESPGLGSQLAREASSWTHRTADFVEQRDPSQLLDELRGVARRRPGAFLACAAIAGVLVGRLARGAASAHNGSPSQDEPGTAAPTTGADVPALADRSAVSDPSAVSDGSPVPDPQFGGRSDYTGAYTSTYGEPLAGSTGPAPGSAAAEGPDLAPPPIVERPYGGQTARPGPVEDPYTAQTAPPGPAPRQGDLA